MKRPSLGPDDHNKAARKTEGTRLRQSLRRAVNKIKTKIEDRKFLKEQRESKVRKRDTK